MASIILQKKWKFLSPDPELVHDLASRANIPDLIARILINRGIQDKSEAVSHLNPSLSSLSDPDQMADMDKAVTRITKAIRDREKITIFGDYDVDGITSCALLQEFLAPLGCKVATYIPHRLNEGYGLNPEAIKRISTDGTTLLITVDCGISCFDEIHLANQLGLDCIVTDHHQVPPTLPPARAILNPKRPDCQFPFKELAGVGVVFNLVRSLRRRLFNSGHWEGSSFPNLKKSLDLVTLGTVADIVPLFGDNRILVRAGLDILENTERPGIKALANKTGIRPPYSTDTIGFIFGPRINAAGRMDHAKKALNLLTTDNSREAEELADELNRLNRVRQEEEAKILKQAHEIASNMGQRHAYVLASRGWHRGVVGIVASRLMDTFYCPIVLLSLEEDTAHGSARSPEGLHLYNMLAKCSDHLEAFGGHACAAGLHIANDKIEEFTLAFESITEKESSVIKEKEPFISLDGRITPDDVVTNNFKHFYRLLEPFGANYPQPLLCLPGSCISDKRIVGGKHLKFNLIGKKGNGVSLLAWGMANKLELSWETSELACVPFINTWNGTSTLQLKLTDIRDTAPATSE